MSKLKNLISYVTVPKYLINNLEEKPRILLLETTNLCNANCCFCSYKFQTREKMFMSQHIFKNAVKQFEEIGGGNLEFNGSVGEPLLDQKLIDRIKYCRSINKIKYISMFTNGLNFNKKKIDAILKSGINIINISISDFNEHSYSDLFGVNSYKKLLINIKNLIQINNKYKNKVKIRLYIRTNKNIKEIIKTKEYNLFRKQVDKIIITNSFDDWQSRVKIKNKKYNFNFMHNYRPCAFVYYSMIVFSDGTIGLCGCRDFNKDSDLILGNIKIDTLKNTYYSNRVNSLRKNWFKGIVPKICINCKFYRKFSAIL